MPRPLGRIGPLLALVVALTVNPAVRAQYGPRRVWVPAPVAGAPAPAGVVTYGYPGNYYQPTYVSYLPYAAPGTGVQPSGTFPVYSISYANPAAPGGVTTFVQASGGDPAARAVYYGQGYTGYNAPTAMYSAGTAVPNWAGPTLAAYGNNLVVNPTNSANIVAPQPTLGPTGVGYGAAIRSGNPGLAPVSTPGLILPAAMPGPVGSGGAVGSGTFGYGVGTP